MTLTEALQNANQILDAERVTPTIRYMSPTPFLNQTAFAMSALAEGGRHPRPVSEVPAYFLLQSLNYDLLKSFFFDLSLEDQTQFIASLVSEYVIQALLELVGKSFAARE